MVEKKNNVSENGNTQVKSLKQLFILRTELNSTFYCK